MLKLIYSNTVNGAADAVLAELKKASGRSIVLVPDSYTLGAEKLVMEYTGLKATLDIEVTGIMRLATRETGKSVLSKEGAVLVMKKVINAHVNELRHYGRVARAAGFAREIFAAITSMRMNGVTPERLEKASEELPDGATKRKNRDLIILYRGYLEALERDGWDGTMRAERFAAEIKDNPRFRGINVFAFGFDSLSGIQIKILTELAAAGTLTAGLVYAPRDANAELMPSDSVRRLLAAASERGVEIRKPVTAYEKVAEPFASIASTLFSGADGSVKDPGGAVTLFGEANIFEEFNAVAREITRLVRREGYRYKDIAVVDAEPEHAKQLKEVFTRYAVPHYIDLRYPLRDTLPARYIEAATDAALFNMRRDKVLRLLKHPLFEWDETEKFEFENYALATNKDFGAFGEPFTGEGSRFEPLRLALENVIKPFSQKGAKAADFAAAAKRLISGEAYEKNVRRCLEGVDENLATSNARAGEKTVGLLDEYVRLAGGESETPEGFRQSFDAAVSAEELALIPRAADSVFVGKLRTGFIYRTRALFILGATQNAFPPKHDFLSIISASDAARLEEAGVRLYPTPYDSMREEQFAVRDLITKTEKLYIGYPMSSATGANKPSGVILELKERLNKPVVRLSESFSPASVKDIKTLEDFTVTPENAVFGYLMHKDALPERAKEAIERALGDEAWRLNANESAVSEDVPMANTLGEKGNYRTSVSRIETFYNCPYSHYLKYGLRLKEREEGKLKPLDVGLISHRVMERYFGKFKGRFHATPRETLDAAAKQIAAEEIAGETRFKNARAYTAALKNLENSLVYVTGRLTDNLLKGVYEPFRTELDFGQAGTKPVRIEVSFGAVDMTGKIDRVDVTEKEDATDKRVAVFDYKTGAACGAPAEIYFGKKLQLAIYLKAAAKTYSLEPAAAFYVPVRDGYTAAGKDFSYKGFMLGDAVAVTEFDRGVAAGEPGAAGFLPVKVKTAADGEIKVSGSGSALGAKQISETLEYAEKVAAAALEDVYRGTVARKPLKGGCKRCVYREVCAGRIEYERAYSKDVTPYGAAPSVSEDE